MNSSIFNKARRTFLKLFGLGASAAVTGVSITEPMAAQPAEDMHEAAIQRVLMERDLDGDVLNLVKMPNDDIALIRFPMSPVMIPSRVFSTKNQDGSDMTAGEISDAFRKKFMPDDKHTIVGVTLPITNKRF